MEHPFTLPKLHEWTPFLQDCDCRNSQDGTIKPRATEENKTMEHKPLPAKRDRSNENLTRTIERLIRRCDKISLRGNFEVYLLVRRNNRYYEYNSASDSSFPASIDEIGRSFPRPISRVTEEDTESSLAQSSSPLQEDDFTSSAAPTGRVVSLRTRPSFGISALCRRDHDSDEEEEPEGRLPSSRTTSDVAKRKVGPSDSSSEEDAEMPGSAPTRQYCSQGCLLGLKKGRDLDNGCPNVLSHRMASEASTRHLINAEEFTRLGTIGVLFKLELEPYGYTFAGKGTWSNRLERLRHECCVYERLESLQGWVVPAQLGLVHLGRGYVLPGGTRAVHMMLMSWGGEEAAKADMDAADLREQWHRSSAAV
ncbi:hypothetical protein V2G26_007199 [Clonostachys chloroleuca]